MRENETYVDDGYSGTNFNRPDCGQTLLVHTDNRNPDRDLLDKTYYQCTTYRQKGANFCAAHRISAGDIESAVKADIDGHAVNAMKDKEKFIKNVLHSMNESSAERSDRTKAEIDKQEADCSRSEYAV